MTQMIIWQWLQRKIRNSSKPLQNPTWKLVWKLVWRLQGLQASRQSYSLNSLKQSRLVFFMGCHTFYQTIVCCIKESLTGYKIEICFRKQGSVTTRFVNSGIQNNQFLPVFYPFFQADLLVVTVISHVWNNASNMSEGVAVLSICLLAWSCARDTLNLTSCEQRDPCNWIWVTTSMCYYSWNPGESRKGVAILRTPWIPWILFSKVPASST